MDQERGVDGRYSGHLTASSVCWSPQPSGRRHPRKTRHLRDFLRAKNYQVIYPQFVSGHDGLSWPGAMANGLQGLLGDAR